MAKHSKSLELRDDEIRALIANGSRILAQWAENSTQCPKKIILKDIKRLMTIAEKLDRKG